MRSALRRDDTNQTGDAARLAAPRMAAIFMPRQAAQHTLQAAVANSPRMHGLAAAAAFSSAPVVQRNVAMKDEGAARRTDGSGPALTAEVAATIARADYEEIITDIARLITSISSRNDDNGRFEAHTPAWTSHKARITLEKGLLKDLNAEKAVLDAAKPKAASKEKAKAPANMFALLGGDDSGDGSDDDSE